MARKPKQPAPAPAVAPLTAPEHGAWPADRVERRAVAGLIPYARNARTHTPEQVAQIAEAVREWGWTMPVLVDERGEIVAGHGRVLAAQQLGLVEVPVMTAQGWTEAQKRAYVIADNRLALSSGWDQGLLKAELGELKLGGFDLALTGFSLPELGHLMPPVMGAGETDPDAVPDADPAQPVITRAGDIWCLGPHRLICGDSTDAATVARLMAGKLAALCFTSPPYGQQRDYKTVIHDWGALMRGVFAVLPVTPAAQVLVNLGLIHRDHEWVPYWDDWIDWMRAAGWRRFGWYVWDQGPGMPGDWNGRLAPAHEFVFHFNRVAERARKTKDKLPDSIVVADGTGQRRRDGITKKMTSPLASLQPRKIPDSVIRVMRHKARGIETAHPAVFPVALPGEFITAYSDPGDIVFEPFAGSGTQIIAAHQHGRACYGCELAPEYVDLAVRRWQLFAGATATLEGTGTSFADTAAARATAAAA